MRVTETGTLVRIFTDGEERTLGQISVALFPAPVCLAAHAGHFLSATADSGAPALGGACEGPRGCVQAGFLEALGDSPGTCFPSFP